MAQIDTFRERAVEFGAQALYAPAEGDALPVPNLGLLDLPDLSLPNGPAALSDGLIAGGAAIELDGVDQYGDTGLATRTNLCANPSFEENLTGWTKIENSEPASLVVSRSNDKSRSGDYSLKMVQPDAGQDDWEQFEVLGVAKGQTFTVSVYVDATGFEAPAVSSRGLFLYDGAGGIVEAKLEEASAGFIRLSATITHSGGESGSLFVRLYAPKGTVYWDDVLVEKTAALGDYFPTPAQLEPWSPDNPEGGLAGWSDPSKPHESAIDIGPYARGTERTLVGVAERADDSNYHYLIGDSSTIWNGLRIQTGASTVELFFAGESAVSWADAWPGSGQRVFWALVFDDAANTATLFINGVSQGERAITGWTVSSSSFWIGARLGFALSWKGAQLPFMWFSYALTPEQIASLSDLVAPETTILTSPDPITPEATATFTFESDDEGATFEARLDGGEWEPATSPFTTPELDEGWHTFEVRAEDEAGNVDTTPAWFGWHIREAAGVPASPTQSPSTPSIPKLRVPLRLENGRLGLCQQGSQENVAACVYAVLSYERGSRVEDVEFGIEDPTFSQLPIDDAEWLEQVAKYEPRAEVSTAQEVDDLIATVLVEVGLGT